jgi:hypothetical protein
MARAQPDIAEAIGRILDLRRVEQGADASVRNDVASAREYLEGLVGPTVRPAIAARLLGISPPALHRRIENGDVAAVMTPEGRREVPLTELLELVEEVERARDEFGEGRPLTRVMNERRRRASESIDLDRLLPRPRGRTHRVADAHSLAYHRLVAERLDQAMVDSARRRLEKWADAGRVHPSWADAWREILALPLNRIARAIASDTARARELRQTSPFAGALNEQERRELVRAVEERFG